MLNPVLGHNLQPPCPRRGLPGVTIDVRKLRCNESHGSLILRVQPIGEFNVFR